MKPKKEEVYEQVYDNEPFEQTFGVSWKLACCHCGLVHDVKIESLGKNLRMTVRQNAAATKRLREADPTFVCKPVKKPRRRKHGDDA